MLTQLSITTGIIAITVLVSLVANSQRNIFQALLFSPFVIRSRNQWYRFITHGFVHAGTMHLFVNMFVLYMFGSSVGTLFTYLKGPSGSLFYVLLYLGGLLASSIPSYKKHLNDPSYNAVGASGAVSAVLFSHILMLPTSPVYLMFIPIPIPAILFGVVYLGYEWYMDKKSTDNVAHDAHFYGAVFGVLFTAVMHPELISRFGYLAG